jgi:hypothetical protein
MKMAAVATIRSSADPYHQRLYAYAIIRLPYHLAGSLHGEGSTAVGSEAQRYMIRDGSREPRREQAEQAGTIR